MSVLNMLLKNKVAIITGSGRGIGRATAYLFAEEGAKVVVNYREDKKSGEEVVNVIKKKGGHAILIQADVSKPEEVKKLFIETIKTFGTVDILVNNAGKYSAKPFLETSFKDIEDMLHTNFIGTFICSQEATKIMLEKKHGKIINVASIKGIEHCARSRRVDYSAAKAAVVNLTKALAAELAPYINVNAVAPGFVETEGMVKTWSSDSKNKAINDTYLKRLMQPEEIAHAILYLASSHANGITGEVLVIDGGYNLK